MKTHKRGTEWKPSHQQLHRKLKEMNTEERQWITGHGNMTIVARACDAFLASRNMRAKSWTDRGEKNSC